MSQSPEQWAALAAADPAAAQRVLRNVMKSLVVPHGGGQMDVVRSQARFKVVRAGRRWGKTKLAARELILRAVANPDSMNWWAANTYKNVRRGYREVLRQIPRQLLAKQPPPPTSNELIIELKNGAIIEFYSGMNPDAMAGEGVDYVVVDEAALQAEHVWNQTIRPALMDTGGAAMLISTPRGRNWFWKLWQLGQKPAGPYESWHFTTADSPYVAEEELDDIKASLPERLYKQEVLAEFLTLADTIFNLEKAVITDDWHSNMPNGHVTMGVDLAKHQDWTVIRATRPDGQPVWYERFQKMSWPEQREHITDAADSLMELGADSLTIGLDTTGLGDVIFDDLDEAGYDVEPIKFSNQWKHQAVKLLGADIEQRRVILLEEQLPEFEAFEYAITPSGNMTYQAPEGQHDDQVTATMIENWVRKHGSPGEVHIDSLEDLEAEEEAVEIVARSAADLMEDPAVWTRA
jgi:hypothetical protein